MRSYDVFDTLIGRRCGTPMRIWEHMGKTLNIPTFVDQRAQAEKRLQQRGKEYNLLDIYKEFGNPELAEVEWLEEIANVFPITRNVDKLTNQDVLISDMYFSETGIRELLDYAGIKFSGKIIVTNSGKRTGKSWEKAKKLGVTSHIGDNVHSDVNTPISYGIHGLLSRTSTEHLTPTESSLFGYSQDLAYWIRRLRLQHVIHENNSDRLNHIFIQYNIPLLFAMSTSLRDYYFSNHFHKLLFMSRDTQLLYKMFQVRFSDTPIEYLFISRDCLINHSKSFMKYLNKRLDFDVSLVDMASSGGSLKEAYPRLDGIPNLFTGVYLKSFGVTFDGIINMTYITDNHKTRINNTLVEMLNYATHWHVADVDENEKPIFDLKDEYCMRKVRKYHDIFEDGLKDMSTEEITRPEPLYLEMLNRIQTEDQFLRITFPNHVSIEKQRKANLKTRNAKVLIVGSIHNYGWDRVRLWWESLIAVNFKGQIHMLVYGDHGVVRALRRKNVIVHQCQLTHPQVVVSRFLDLAELCKTLPKDLWVISSDVSDIVFQWDPAIFLDSVEENIVVASEGIRHDGNEWVVKNFNEAFPEYWKNLKDKQLYNAGSVAARAGVMAEFAQEIYDLSMQRPHFRSHDQAAMNILLNEERYKKQTLFVDVNGPWCFCAASSMLAKPQDKKNYLGKPVTVKNGVCYTKPNTMVCMFHHYDRDPILATSVRNHVHQEYLKSGRQI